MVDQNSTPEPVWIHCRANEKCEGNQAVIVFQRSQKTGDRKAVRGFNIAERVGKLIRYRCLTCNGTFHIGK